MLDFARELEECMRVLATDRPLVHHMTNDVAVASVADATVALGASPIMARSPVEAYDMVGGADALVLNMGTPDSDSAVAMLEAGERAGWLGIPVLLDPAGVGSTEYRTILADDLLRRVKIDVIRANRGEVAALLGAEDAVRGVQSAVADGECIRRSAVTLARDTGAVVAMTGATDWVTDGRRTVRLRGGHPLMGRAVGTGCLSSAVIGCLMTAAAPFRAACAGLRLLAVAGERAAAGHPGPAGFRTRLIDTLYHIARNVPGELAGEDAPDIWEEE